MRDPDPTFADPRQAALYDALNGDRSDLDAYLAIADEVSARRVIDIGCGTGSLAVRLAERGFSVVGVDPATASLDVARTKPFAELVTWVAGDATALVDLELAADLAVMTGNVAQVFVSDGDWSATLRAIRASLRAGGWFVFETRRPEVRDWETWSRPPSPVTLPDGRPAIVACTVTEVALPFVTFEGSTAVGGETLLSASTLRFRERDEIERDLGRHGFAVADVRDAPDRPGKEMVFVARSVDGTDDRSW
ncbi:class I SAM-dependent DNA methyltransferase [Microlunatus ginsengisoli]|uniref:Class I SAM-dependent methyltransferase n=1 Tax=Microlunatus ginsengisoli TaxID=363863 RepID=A0ABP7ASM6_9ACTN